MRRLLIIGLLAGCSDGQSLESLKAQAAGKYEVIYTDTLPRGTKGQTYRMGDGPAIVVIASDMNKASRDGVLAHELRDHVLGNVSHPPKPPRPNVAVPDRGAFWDRMKMGMPQ